MRKRLTRRVIAWSVAVAQVVILIECVAFYAWSGDWFAAELAIVGLIAFALVGALIVSQPAHFRFGWFLLLAPVPAVVSFLASEYVDIIQIHHVALPLEGGVWWFGNWAWIPSFGMAIGMLDPKEGRIQEWKVPTPWSAPCDAMAGRNGEAWTGSMLTDRVSRLDIKSGEYTEYQLPRSTNIRRVYVDDGKKPGTLWIGSNHGASIVKVEPLE